MIPCGRLPLRFHRRALSSATFPRFTSGRSVAIVDATSRGTADSKADLTLRLRAGAPLGEVSHDDGMASAGAALSVGLGDDDGGNLTVDSWRRALSAGLDRAALVHSEKVRSTTTAKGRPYRLAIELPNDQTNAIDVSVATTLANVAMLHGYSFSKYKSVSADGDDDGEGDGSSAMLIHHDIVVGGDGGQSKSSVPPSLLTAMQEAVAEQVALSDCTSMARDLSNERADVADPAYLENVALRIAGDHGLGFRSLQHEELRETGLNMLAAVGQAAACPPRLVELRYDGNPGAKDEVVALVGKGVTFDTGGLNLKPTGFIEDMHMDKSGAVAVLAAMEAVGRLQPNVNVVGVVALAENAIGPAALRPHTILESLAGKTVEVGNTDAEGRLCLADAMTWVQREHAPHTVIDVATLTGACIVALGEYTAGLWSNDDELAEGLVAAGDRCFERCWRMPVLAEHSKEITEAGGFSDLRSIGKGRDGGACTAAAFLQEFAEDGVKWAHIDIAGPAFASAARGHIPKGSTGFGAALLVEYLKSLE